MPRERAFTVSLVFSALFHLTMVTVFSIGIRFPVTPTRYYSLRIVPQRTVSFTANDTVSTGERHVLRVPNGDYGLDVALSVPMDSADVLMEHAPRLHSTGQILDELPHVDLPRLEFAGLERLRLQRQSLQIRQRYETFWESSDSDWFGVARGLARLRDVFSLGHDADLAENALRITPQKITSPASGFELYIEWMSEPKTRPVLFSAPIDALVNADPRTIPPALNYIFRVSPDGQVKEVLPGSPGTDDELTASVRTALLNYRFAPLDVGKTGDQYGTLIIRPGTR